MTDALVSEPFIDEFHWDDYGIEAPTAATARYWRYTTAGGKEYLQSDESSFAAGVHDFTATSLGGGGFQFISASLATGFQGKRIHREARATGPLASYPIQPWDGFVTANDEDDNQTSLDAITTLIQDIQGVGFTPGTHDLVTLRTFMSDQFDEVDSLLEQLGVAAEIVVTPPKRILIPESGSTTRRVYLLIRDLDQSPTAIRKADSDLVDSTIISSPATGITLSGTPAGRWTLDETDATRPFYFLDVTVDSTATASHLTLSTALSILSQPNLVHTTVSLVDEAQIDRIEDNTDILLARVGTPTDAVDDPTLFGQHFDTQADIAAEHNTTRTLIQDETDAIDAVLATIQETGDGGFNRETDSLEAIRDRIDAIDAATNPTTISDAVWDEAAASHVAAGSFGEEVQSHLTRSEATADKNEVKTHVTTEHNTTRALITDIQSGTRLRHSWTSIGDAGIDGGQVRLRINLTDDTTGDVPSASIDITAATAVLERSRAGAAFTATGITQPTIAKENGGVIVEFDLVGTEWRPGDEAHLTLKGVKASSRFIPAASWLFQPNAAGGFTPDFGG